MATLNRPAVREPDHLHSGTTCLVPGIYLDYLEEKGREKQLATKFCLIWTSDLPKNVLNYQAYL